MRKEIIGECTLYLGDCLEVLPTLDKVDALVCDPPYGIGESSKNFASRSKLASADKYELSAWDDITADEAIKMGISISQYQIIFGGNYYALPPTSCWLVWNKLNGDSDFADCELAWTNLKKAVRKIDCLWNGCMRVERDIERQHPTQKPVKVMQFCLEQLPASCQTILDPFMGSGTTGVACAKMGRRFIGVELEERYFDIACKRIEEAYKQPDLFVKQVKSPEQQALL